MAACKECNGTGTEWCKQSTDGGKTWSDYDRQGERAYTFCRACDGTGDGEHAPTSSAMPEWAGNYKA